MDEKVLAAILAALLAIQEKTDAVHKALQHTNQLLWDIQQGKR
jgi:hypothetical protein